MNTVSISSGNGNDIENLVFQAFGAVGQGVHTLPRFLQEIAILMLRSGAPRSAAYAAIRGLNADVGGQITEERLRKIVNAAATMVVNSPSSASLRVDAGVVQ